MNRYVFRRREQKDLLPEAEARKPDDFPGTCVEVTLSDGGSGMGGNRPGGRP